MNLHFLANKIGVIVTLPYLDRKQNIEESESTLQAQVLCKY